MISNLIAKSVLKVSPVTVAGETIYVKEPTYAQLTAWREKTATGNVEDANAGLFFACIVDESGDSVVTADDARALARGSIRVLNPLLTAITGQLKEDAKNA